LNVTHDYFAESDCDDAATIRMPRATVDAALRRATDHADTMRYHEPRWHPEMVSQRLK
jgi:hypothetical protein